MQQNPTHLPQTALIERVRQLCRADEQVIAALMFDSFASVVDRTADGPYLKYTHVVDG